MLNLWTFVIESPENLQDAALLPRYDVTTTTTTTTTTTKVVAIFGAMLFK